MEDVTVVWEIEPDSLVEVGGVDADLDEDVKGFDCRLVHWY